MDINEIVENVKKYNQEKKKLEDLIKIVNSESRISSNGRVEMENKVIIDVTRHPDDKHQSHLENIKIVEGSIKATSGLLETERMRELNKKVSEIMQQLPKDLVEIQQDEMNQYNITE